MLDLELDGKVALVTGANHGIGAAIARLLAEQGARVFIAYYRRDTELSNEELEATRREAAGGPALYHAMQQQPAEVTVEKIRAAGGTAVAEHADLESAAAAVELVGRCEETFGSVDILINNHAHCQLETFDPAMGPQLGMEVELTDATGIDRHFAVNARASALMMREYLKRHIARRADWGRIISLTTALIHPWNISYAASKRALVSFTLSAAAEMGKYGITANVVCPGATQTGYIDSTNEARCVERTPLGRLGTPEDVAHVVLLMTSTQADWLTGQLVYASGGFSMFMRE